jgi:hypothetical protein
MFVHTSRRLRRPPPRGIVQVDRQHPNMQGCVGYWWGLSGDARVRDLIGGRDVYMPIGTPNPRYTSKGVYTSNTGLLTTDDYTLPPMTSHPFTIAVAANLVVGVSTREEFIVISKRDITTSLTKAFGVGYNNTRKLEGTQYINTFRSLYQNISLAAGTRLLVVFVVGGPHTDSMSLYANGKKLVTSVSGAGENAFPTDTGNWVVSIGGLYRPSIIYGYSLVEHAAIYGRALSDSEIAYMNDHEFDHVSPELRRNYFIPAMGPTPPTGGYQPVIIHWGT